VVDCLMVHCSPRIAVYIISPHPEPSPLHSGCFMSLSSFLRWQWHRIMYNRYRVNNYSGDTHISSVPGGRAWYFGRSKWCKERWFLRKLSLWADKGGSDDFGAHPLDLHVHLCDPAARTVVHAHAWLWMGWTPWMAHGVLTLTHPPCTCLPH
jgi:hypothetical protein